MSEEPQPPVEPKKKKRGPRVIGVPIPGVSQSERAARFERAKAAGRVEQDITAALREELSGEQQAAVAQGVDPNVQRQVDARRAQLLAERKAREEVAAERFAGFDPNTVDVNDPEQAQRLLEFMDFQRAQRAAPVPTVVEANEEDVERPLDSGEFDILAKNLDEARAEQLKRFERDSRETLGRPPSNEEQLIKNYELEVVEAEKQAAIDQAIADQPAVQEVVDSERAAYRRFEQRNTEALRNSIRAIGIEGAEINGRRIDDPRFAAWYARHQTHAVDSVEDYYKRKLSEGRYTIYNVLDAFALLRGNSAFDDDDIDHMSRDVIAWQVSRRRVKRYESQGRFDKSARLKDVNQP